MILLHPYRASAKTVSSGRGSHHLALIFSFALAWCSPVSPSTWAGKLSLMAGASHRGQSRMLGGLWRSTGGAFKGTPLCLKQFHGVHVESRPPALLAPTCEKLCAVRKHLPSPLVQCPGPVAFRWHKVGSPSSSQGLGQTFLQLFYCSLHLLLQGVVWCCGMTDLCKSSCRAKCLLVPCAFMFLKLLALVRLGLKIYFKVDTH